MVHSDVKRHIRARYGTIKAFEKAKGLRPYAVRDHLRGRSVSAAERVISLECGPHELERPRLKRRQTSSPPSEREAAEARCATRLAELTAALDRAVEAVRDLKALAGLA